MKKHRCMLYLFGAIRLKALCKKDKLQNSENTMEVGGWVQVSLGIFFLNHPQIALNQY